MTLRGEPLALSTASMPRLKAPAAKTRKTTTPAPPIFCKKRGTSRRRLRAA